MLVSISPPSLYKLLPLCEIWDEAESFTIDSAKKTDRARRLICPLLGQAFRSTPEIGEQATSGNLFRQASSRTSWRVNPTMRRVRDRCFHLRFRACQARC